MFLKRIFSLMSAKSANKIFIGNELLRKLIADNSKLLISEDLAALKSAFESEFELIDMLNRNDCGASLVWANMIHSIVVILALCVFIVWNQYTLLAGVFFLISFSIILLVVLFLSVIYYRKYCTDQFKGCFELLVSQILHEKELFKKLMQLIEDNSVFAMSANQQKRVNTLKICFRDIGWQCFVEYRDCTLLLMAEFPLKDDIDNDLICLFPQDSFESYHNDEELNHKSLKSLKQLTRLQISEFFKRVLFLFIMNYYKNPENFKKNYYSFLKTRIFNLCLKNTQERQSKLLSVLSYHKSLIQEKIDINKIDLYNKNVNLWPVCRNIRKDLYSSLSIIDDCESLLETNIDISSEIKAILESKFTTLIDEIDDIRDSSKSLLKSLALSDLQNMSNENDKIEDNNANIEKNNVHNIGEFNIVEEVPKDEVFEAYVNQSDREQCNDVFCNNDKSFTAEIVASDNVYRELKNALQGKAIEHKVREAKAQGIDVDVKQLEEEYIKDMNKENIIDKHNTNVDQHAIDTIDVNEETTKEFLNFDFNFALNLRLDANEDTFEYDSECKSDSYLK